MISSQTKTEWQATTRSSPSLEGLYVPQKRNFDTSEEKNNSVSQVAIKRVRESEDTYDTCSSLRARRQNCPVTTQAIKLTATLFEAERHGLNFASKQRKLKVMVRPGRNLIVEMTKPNQNENSSQKVAYFKRGPKGEFSAAIMETLMWDIAVILGMEDLFTPTKPTTVSSKTEIGLRGGIQPAQPGTLLKEVMSHPAIYGKPKRESVINATLASMVFGMFDAHSENIIMDRKGNLKFFDNARSMHHTNSFIFWWNDIILPSYHSCFLGLPDSYIGLSNREFIHLQNQLRQYWGKMPVLEKFLFSPQTQSRIKKLPPGWMNCEGSMNAIKERIVNIKNAMKGCILQNHPAKLRDLIVTFNPSFRWSVVLLLLEGLCKNPFNHANPLDFRKMQMDLLPNVGILSINSLLQVFTTFGIDLDSIKELCDDPKNSLDDIWLAMTKIVTNGKKNGPPPTKMLMKVRRDTSRMKKKIMELATKNFKE